MATPTIGNGRKIVRQTRYQYGHNKRYTRNLMVQFKATDVIEVWPSGSRRHESIGVHDLYRIMVNRRVSSERAAKAKSRNRRILVKRGSL